MDPKLDDLLCARYPGLYGDSFCFDAAPGWFVLVDTLSAEVASYVAERPDERSVTATDVKEKRGALCWYYFGGGDDDDYLDGLIWFAEHLSQRICQECGAMDCASHTWWRRDPPPETRRLPAVRNPAWIPIAEELERTLHSAVRRGAPEVVIEAAIETETLAYQWTGGNREIAGFFAMAEAFSARIVGEYIRGLAKLHGVTYVKNSYDDLANVITRLSDDDVEMDETELLLIALERAGVIPSEVVVSLHIRYLREKLPC